MAEECISVVFENGKTWTYCWEYTTPHSAWQAENVTTGLRKSHSTQSKAWRTCQYYVKGQPAVCTYWQEGDGSEETIASGTWACHYVVSNTSDNPNDPLPDIPTGFNNSYCDFLGRRSWCDKYKARGGDYSAEDYICAAPNPYLTGLGKREISGIRRPIFKGEIFGYNDEDTNDGSGKCDCYGMGRGKRGCSAIGGVTSSKEIESTLQKLPRICNYYRPWQMGFGAIQPDTLADKRIDDAKLIRHVSEEEKEKAYQRLDSPLDRRMPIQFEFYNYRAQFQKCQWWDSDEGSKFGESGDQIVLEGDDVFDNETGKVTLCKCTDTAADLYNHRILADDIPWWAGGQYLTANIIAGKVDENGEPQFPGGYVCNGCRPECPAYSGKWIYLTEEKMLPGMPITANQILELRFWAANWETQKQYDDYFMEKPNFNDPRSASIFTFKKWINKSTDVTASRMEGRELTLCQPAPFFNREFDPEAYITSSIVTYGATFGITSGGTAAPGEKFFPSLIRIPEFLDLKPLEIIYPYYNDNALNAEVCKKQGDPGHIKRHNTIYGDSITVVGYTVRNKNVYAVNLSKVNALELASYGYLINNPDNSGMISINPEKWQEAYAELAEIVYVALKKYPEYIVEGNSDSEGGHFILDPVKLEYGKTNQILICVDLGNGAWEFRKRFVISKWYGGIIYQLTYNHYYPSNDEDSNYIGSGYNNTQPLGVTPPATAAFVTIPMGSSDHSENINNPVFDVFRNEVASFMDPIVEYSYSIVKVTETKTEAIDSETGQSTGVLWGAIGNSNKIWVEIDDLNLNYIYSWEVKSAVLKPKPKEDETDPLTGLPISSGDETERPNAVPVNMQAMDIDRNSIPPSAIILEPVDDVRIRFFRSEWELTVEYEYETLTNENLLADPNFDTSLIVYGAGKTELDRYVIPSHNISNAYGAISVDNIINDTVALLAYFLDENGRLISTMATKACLEIVSERCRNIDIYYSYKATGKAYALQPEKGFCIDIRGDKMMYGEAGVHIHVETPDCMDHDVFQYPGPMWFPFNACRGYDMYDEYTICNNCQAGYVGPINDGVAKDSFGNPVLIAGQVLKRNDYRYCGPYKFDAWGEVRGNWAAACDCGCSFYYSDASSATPVFIGYGRIREPINLAGHIGAPPPFGNDGRNLIEKFISHDHTTHFLVNSVITRSEWEPMVMDNSAFFMSFNARDKSTDVEETNYASTGDYFNFINQLNFNILARTGEFKLPIGIASRYRFDDLFEVQYEGNCTYPPPARPTFVGNSTFVNYYTFKIPEAQWAWQEYWKDIERNLDDELPTGMLGEDDTTSAAGKLEFVNYVKPKYIFSYYKQEHRLIASEGEHFVIFRGPKLDPDTGEMTEYPTISLDGSHPRPFEIFYDNYNDNQITWIKEGGQAKVDGSSDADNPYEETDPARGPWAMDPDTIFDSEAVTSTEAAKAAGREIIVGRDESGEIPKYYNRGIIARIKRNRLDYMPKAETEYVFKTNPDKFEAGAADSITVSGTPRISDELRFRNLLIGAYVWDSASPFLSGIGPPEVAEGEEPQGPDSYALARLMIKGNWGTSIGRPGVINKYVKPGVSVSLLFKDDTTGSPRGLSSPLTALPKDGQGMEEYIIELKFLLGPNEMIRNKAKEFTITFTGGEGYYISIDEIKLYLADYIDVQAEKVQIWERKYIISKADYGQEQFNLDGPGNNLQYHLDLTNGGLYYPFKGSRAVNNPDEVIISYDKMRSVYTTEYHHTVEYLDLSYNNLHNVEANEQEFQYKDAFGLDASNNYSYLHFETPTKYEGFLNYTGLYSVTNLRFPLMCTYFSEKLKWELHNKYKAFKQYDFWRPGGHQYAWSTQVRFENCMIFGTPKMVHSGYYIHVDHYGVGTKLEVDPSKPIDPGNAYYSYRFYVQQAKYDRFLILSGVAPEGGYDLVTSANMYNQARPIY